MIRSILLATDGSAPAERAAAVAASLGRRYGARVTVGHAYSRLPEEREGVDDCGLDDPIRSEAIALVDNVVRRLRELGVTTVSGDTMAGAAVEVILMLASIYQADVIVIGARGQSPWQGLVLGSVSLAVTQRAPCAVLVVK